MNAGRRTAHEDPDAVRMTIGEHLEELRGCVWRSLVALVLACVICIWPAKYLLIILTRPVVLALQHHGQPNSFLATSPTEPIVIYIKVVVVAGLILAAPYIIRQVWGFVASGLYRHEKDWAYKLVPVSVGLFFVGVVFMYVFVLILSLNFLIGFGAWLPLPTGGPNAMEQLLLGTPHHPPAMTQPAGSQPAVPFLDRDPDSPPPGTMWFNVIENKLKIRSDGETYHMQMTPGDNPALLTSHFRLGEYINFVLILTIAFGAAFQMPLVVYFLVRSGIASVKTLRSYRKVVILLIVIVAGILAPPDLLSHLLLSGPMILLFELGLLVAARKPAAESAPAPASDGH